MLTQPHTPADGSDILERLRHPEREHERQKTSRNLFVRNILNTLFILLAVIAMIGIVATPKGNGLMKWYAVGLFAVVVKMVEAVMRMPHMRTK